MLNLTAEEKTAEAVFDMLMNASFEKWYENEFRDFVEGGVYAPTKAEILNLIKKRLRGS